MLQLPGNNRKRKFDSSGVVTRVKRADGSVAVCLDLRTYSTCESFKMC